MIMDLQLQTSYGAFINNELQLLSSPSFPAINAATGQHLAEIARCGQKEIDAAVCAAEVAFPAWKALGFEDRARMFHRFATRANAPIVTALLVRNCPTRYRH